MNVYHYTSLENAIAIISGIFVPHECIKESKLDDAKITFHASRYNCMNDPNEITFARDIVHKVLHIDHDTVCDCDLVPYILSFSRSCENTLMWRLYNSSIAFVFDNEALIGGSEQFWVGQSVCYTDEDGHAADAFLCTLDLAGMNSEEINTEYLEVRRQCIVYPFIKHKSFEVEDEWRLSIPDVRFNKIGNVPEASENFHETTDRVMSKGTRYGLPWLYKEVDIPARALKGIIINEHNPQRFERVKEDLTVLLNSRGFRVPEGFITRAKTIEVRN